MTPDKTHIIFGPPGTGKTTRLLNIADEYLKGSYKPNEICFVSFTRKAAYEARDRAIEKFNLDKSDLPYFRTLHSLAWEALGMLPAQMINNSDKTNIAKELGLFFSLRDFYTLPEEINIIGSTKGDRLMMTEQLARSKMIDLKTEWNNTEYEDIPWEEMEQFWEYYSRYKFEKGKMDFIDMISNFNKVAPELDHKILIVDEVQDLTQVQWGMIDVLSETAEYTYIAGDDDQAIYRWSGADVYTLQNIPGKREILTQSYRCPEKVWDLASKIISKVKHRVAKDWKPRLEEGTVEYIDEIWRLDMTKGTWLILVRNNKYITDYEEYCLTNGLFFRSVRKTPDAHKALQAIFFWEELRDGKPLTAGAIKKVYSFMRKNLQYGAKSILNKYPETSLLTLTNLSEDIGLKTQEIWYKALDKLTPLQIAYYWQCRNNGEKLKQEPRILISTIHQVKGGEADNVVLDPEIGLKTWEAAQTNPEEEARVWYVGVTRAKKSVYILQPISKYYYEL
tara:strand:- start:2397 stop:3914 length:1518 start_codon:yes stop_codon:yes gene_type:complete